MPGYNIIVKKKGIDPPVQASEIAHKVVCLELAC